MHHKARWVVKGFEQREGLDYNETFASVVKPMSYKALFAIAAAKDLEIEQMDVKTAFLYGAIEEDIYMEQPMGFENSDLVCKLNKALYGLKQSPRVWYNTFTQFLKELGFTALSSDLCIFHNSGTYIAVFVDDLLIVGPSKSDINEMKEKLNIRFHMTDLGPCHYYLGMEVSRDRQNRTIHLSQKGYIEKVLRDFSMWECKPNATPMETSTTTTLEQPDDQYRAEPELLKWYQSAVGSLMYAMLGTRPDIAFAISVVSRYASNPTTQHQTAVKRVFRYLRGSVNLRLTFRGDLKFLTGYSDADWAGDRNTRRSTSGYIFNVGSGAISWSSKQQPTVALSTCEAEYIGQTHAAKEAIWLKALIDQLNPENSSPMATIIYGDNQGAIALAKNPQFHARTKHIDIQHHFIREKINEGKIELKYVPTAEQVADGLTKALCKDKFLAFRHALGLEEY